MNYSKSLIAIVFFWNLVFNSTYAQGYVWAKSMGGVGLDYVNSVATDKMGNIYITGQFRSTVDFDPGVGTANLVSAGNYDIFIAKYNSNGVYKWAVKIGGLDNDIGRSIICDSVGNIFLGGDFEGNVDFDPGVGTYPLSSGTGRGMFISKLDSNGNHIWSKALTCSGNGLCRRIASDGGKNLFITGDYTGTVDFDPGAGVQNITSKGDRDAYFARYDTSGNYYWSNSLGGLGAEYGTGIAVSSVGVYGVGYFNSDTVDFDPGTPIDTLSSNGSNDIFFLKYETNGVYRWAHQIGNSSADLGRSIAVDGSENVYITGYFQSTVDLDPDTSNNFITSNGGQDIFIAKYDSAGKHIWGKGMGGNGIEDGLFLTLDKDTNLYFAGTFQNTVDFDPGPGISNLTAVSSTFSWDACFVKFDPKGTFLFAKSIRITSGGLTESSTISSISLGGGNDVYLGGFFSGSIDVDPDTGSTILSSNGSTDFFIGKYSQNLCGSSGNPVYSQSVNVSICDGDSISLGGSYRYSAGVYYDSLQTVKGCDSTIVYTLTLDSNVVFNQTLSICNGDSLLLGGSYQSAPGVYNDTLQTSKSCDSVVVTTLIVTDIDTSVTTSLNDLSSNESGAVYQWLDCNTGYTQINGATSSVYTPTVNGSYAVLVTKNGCTDTSACHPFVLSGIQNLNLGSQVLVMPNPVKDKLEILLPPSAEAGRITLFDIQGKVVFWQDYLGIEKVNIDVSHLPAGAYTLLISGKNVNDKRTILKG